MTDDVCSECGGRPRQGRTCQELLHELLERKYAADAAEYGLAVACYTLQHPARQSAKALEWAHFHLTLAVQHGLPLDAVRRAARAQFDQHRYQATASPVRSVLHRARWHMTIGQLDASASGTDAERLLCWARAILEDVDTAAPSTPTNP
jgi:hypothetical protein